MTHSNTIVRALVNRALSSAQSPMGAQIDYDDYDDDDDDINTVAEVYV